MALEVGKPQHNRQKLPDVVRPLRKRSSVEDLRACVGYHASELHHPWVSRAGGVHRQRRQHRLHLAPCNTAQQIPAIIILAQYRCPSAIAFLPPHRRLPCESRLCFGKRGEGLVFSPLNPFHLGFTFRPRSEDTCLLPLPNDIEFLLYASHCSSVPRSSSKVCIFDLACTSAIC